MTRSLARTTQLRALVALTLAGCCACGLLAHHLAWPDDAHAGAGLAAAALADDGLASSNPGVPSTTTDRPIGHAADEADGSCSMAAAIRPELTRTGQVDPSALPVSQSGLAFAHLGLARPVVLLAPTLADVPAPLGLPQVTQPAALQVFLN